RDVGASGLNLRAERLKGDRAMRPADKGMGTYPSPDSRLHRGPAIGTGECAGPQGARWRKHHPLEIGCTGRTDVDTVLSYVTPVTFISPIYPDEVTIKRLVREDDEARAPIDDAGEDANPNGIHCAGSMGAQGNGGGSDGKS